MTITFEHVKALPEKTELLAVPVFADGSQPDGSPVELAGPFLRSRGFDGEVGKTLALLAEDGSTILAVGVGKADQVDGEVVRRAAACIIRASGSAKSVTTTLLDACPDTLDRKVAAQALAEGAALSTYRFNTYKSKGGGQPPSPVATVRVASKGGVAIQKALDRGAAIAEAVSLARDLVNTPPRDMTPRHMADAALALAKKDGLTVEIWDEKRIAKEKLGGLQAVSAGSAEPPRLIKMEWAPPKARTTIYLVGKGITFDSGGLNLKSYEGMLTMKCDMAGAAAVIGAMSALPAINARVRVVGLAACSENLPSGTANKPSDVLTIRNGKTVEVHNTDAEGRLVLADALSLATEAKPDAIIDLATLTGACTVALGTEIAGAMGTSTDLLDQIDAASARTGEPFWQLPLPDRYRKHIDSLVADIKNVGAPGGKAGTLTAGLFLREFVDDTPWAHLDIAGPAFMDVDEAHFTRFGTGFAVRTLLDLIGSFRKPKRG
ncbi:MAG: leucyl aminopeptidase [Acidimicrobiales bacterium]